MISNLMTSDHRKCDENFGSIEELVDKKQFQKAIEVFIPWKNGMLHHLDLEEKYLFQELEQKLGGKIGPIIMMEMEHGQIRELISQMEKSINDKRHETYLGLADSCMLLIQQHNMKEEQVLYPMMDKFIDINIDELVEKINNGTI